MGVKAAILDLDGTLVHDGSHELVDGVPEMLAELRASGLKIAIASNRPGAVFRAARAGLESYLFLGPSSVGKRKGAREWVPNAYDPLRVSRHEVVYLGDKDHDMRSAVNARVPYFHAYWSEPNHKYGLRMYRPASFSLIVRECFMKDEPWFAYYEGVDSASQAVRTFSMTDSWGGGNQELEQRTVDFLKDGKDTLTIPMKFGVFVAFHLLGSLTTSGLSSQSDVWTIYPGSKKGSINASLEPFITEAARLFKDGFYRDLLIRHTTAPDSGRTRYRGGTVDIKNQVVSMQVNPQYRDIIAGKHVVVVDDFETEGHSLECARLLLYRAGARAVTGVTISRYMMSGHRYARHVWTYTGNDWDPFGPTAFDPASFRSALVQPERTDAPSTFRQSYERVFR